MGELRNRIVPYTKFVYYQSYRSKRNMMTDIQADNHVRQTTSTDSQIKFVHEDKVNNHVLLILGYLASQVL